MRPFFLAAFLVALCLSLLASAAHAQRSTPVMLVNTSPSDGELMGNSVAVDGDTLVAGTPFDGVGSNSRQGSAQVYRWTGSGWVLESTLLASDGAAHDFFGGAVAISGDTIVVSALGDDVGTAIDRGSAYVFVRSGTTWTQRAKLQPPESASGDQFGVSVAIDADTVVVGTLNADTPAMLNTGAAYVFTRSGTSWPQAAKLVASDAATGDGFGCAVAVDASSIVVGASNDILAGGAPQGSAYVFTRSVATWAQQGKLAAPDGAAGDRFGASVCISGDTVLVGAWQDDVDGNVNEGSVHVFTRTGGLWAMRQQLTADDGVSQAFFGCSVAISGDSVLVGSLGQSAGDVSGAGAAYVFTRSGATLTQQSKLSAGSAAAPASQFGWSVSLSGDIAAIGVPYDDSVSSLGYEGSVRVFSRVGTTWIGDDFSMIGSAVEVNDGMGMSVDVSGDTAVVGVPFDDFGGTVDRGSAYVFVRSGTAWVEQGRLMAPDSGAGDMFGYSVAVDGNTILVGSPFHDLGNVDQGAVYAFTRSGVVWTQQGKVSPFDWVNVLWFGFKVDLQGDTGIVGCPECLGGQGAVYDVVRSGSFWSVGNQLVASDGVSPDRFGAAVAVDRDTLAVGADWATVDGRVLQGAAYVFRKSIGGWTQQAKLTQFDGEAGDRLGGSVAVSGSTIVVGAPADDVGFNIDQGSAAVYARFGSSWLPQATLTAPDGEAGDQFGHAVAIDDDTIVVGAPIDDFGELTGQGSAHVFARTNGVWVSHAMLVAPVGTAFGAAGQAVAIDGSVVLVGMPLADTGIGGFSGMAMSHDIPRQDLSGAFNATSGFAFGGLGNAVIAAQTGQMVTASEAAWRLSDILDGAGRSLALRGDGKIAMPSSSFLSLGGSSSLGAASGRPIDIFGQLRLSSGASADLFASSFRLGSRGSLTARTGSSLSVNAPAAVLQGQTRVEQGASLTFQGGVKATGPTTANIDSAIAAGDVFTNIDTFTITAGTITTPLFANLSQANIFGSSAVFGGFFNEAGATTTIRSGTLYVFGSLTNNGTLVGTICSTCSGLPPAMDVGGSLALGPAANLAMPFVGSIVRVGGDFDCAIDHHARFDLAQATLQLEALAMEQRLEAMSVDIGADPAGFDRSIAGHFPIHTLHLGPSPSAVTLVDTHDNDGLGQGSCEALYVDTLRIDVGSRLINLSCRIYCNTLINDGVIDVPANVIVMTGTPCPADFNLDGGVDGADVVDFFAAWEAGEMAADVNLDGGVDGSDVDVFYAAWEAGGC